MILSSKRNAHTQGFSLVELLVVIAVIGILAAVAVTGLSFVTDSSRASKNRKNAQQLVSLYYSAKSMGVPANQMPTIPGDGENGSSNAVTSAKNIASTFSTPRTGVGVTSGVKLQTSLSPSEAESAANYLAIRDGEVIYLAGGDQ